MKVAGFLYFSGCNGSSSRRIHCYDGPVSDADGQEEKGDDRVEESGHDVADGPRNKKDQTSF